MPYVTFFGQEFHVGMLSWDAFDLFFTVRVPLSEWVPTIYWLNLIAKPLSFKRIVDPVSG